MRRILEGWSGCPYFYVAPVSAWEYCHALLPGNLAQVMIDVAGGINVVGYYEEWLFSCFQSGKSIAGALPFNPLSAIRLTFLSSIRASSASPLDLVTKDCRLP